MIRSAPTILVVDDDPEMRAYLRLCLRSLTDRVVETVDGAAALALLRESGPGAFDLVIADVVMPGLDGLSLRKTLAAEPSLGAPSVLLVTGEVPGPGDEPILRKPFNAVSLRRRVESLLARRR
jgi:CheY-like chemotaxis protein